MGPMNVMMYMQSECSGDEIKIPWLRCALAPCCPFLGVTEGGCNLSFAGHHDLAHQSPLTNRVHPRFPFHLSGGTLTAGGECPHEKVIDSFPVDLCPADHSGLSRSWLFTLRYPAPVPIPILQLRAKILPSTRL